LARELKERDKVDDIRYKLTGQTGTDRYMAPEVYKGEPYNHLADIYSYSMLLWEMYTFCHPFQTYDRKMHQNLVMNKGYRPKVDKMWPLPIKSMMNRCWASDVNERPAAENILKILKPEIVALRGDDKCLEHSRRRSTFIMQ